MNWEILGIFAGLIVATGFVPQIIRGIRTKKLDDISYFMLFFLTGGMAVWIAYGMHFGSFPVIFANVLGVFFNLILIALKYYLSKTTS